MFITLCTCFCSYSNMNIASNDWFLKKKINQCQLNYIFLKATHYLIVDIGLKGCNYINVPNKVIIFSLIGEIFLKWYAVIVNTCMIFSIRQDSG